MKSFILLLAIAALLIPPSAFGNGAKPPSPDLLKAYEGSYSLENDSQWCPKSVRFVYTHRSLIVDVERVAGGIPLAWDFDDINKGPERHIEEFDLMFMGESILRRTESGLRLSRQSRMCQVWPPFKCGEWAEATSIEFSPNEAFVRDFPDASWQCRYRKNSDL